MARDSATSPDWRHPSDYDELLEIDRPGLAWELLRRNRRYRRETAKLARPADEGILTVTPALARIAAGWGLCFPRGSIARREVRAALLAR